MKTIFTKTGVILCLFELSALYLMGLAVSADASIWFEANIPKTYIHYLIDFCIIGLSLAWFCHTQPGESSAHPYRWCRLLPAALVMSYQNFRWEISGYVPKNGDEWWEFVYWVSSFLLTFLACCLITQVIQAIRNHTSPKWKIIVKAFFAGFLIWATYWPSHYFNDYVQWFYAFFLPMYFYLAAKGINCLCSKYERLKTWANPLYFLTTIILILFSLFHFVWYGFHSDEMVQSIYLCVTAGMALWFVYKEQNPDSNFGQWFFRNKGRKFYESPLLGTGLVSAFALLTNERFYEIIASVKEETAPEVTVVDSEVFMRFYNWFAYRWETFIGNLCGNLDTVNKFWAHNVPLYNSMAWLNAEYGILTVLAALVLLTGAFFLLLKCAKNSDRLSRYLYAVLLLRTVLGLIANLLVVYSTEITPLMMGLMPWDIIFVIMILWRRTDRHENKGQ